MYFFHCCSRSFSSTPKHGSSTCQRRTFRRSAIRHILPLAEGGMGEERLCSPGFPPPCAYQRQENKATQSCDSQKQKKTHIIGGDFSPDTQRDVTFLGHAQRSTASHLTPVFGLYYEGVAHVSQRSCYRDPDFSNFFYGSGGGRSFNLRLPSLP